MAASPKGHTVLPEIESVTFQRRSRSCSLRLARLDPLEQPQHPARALAAGRALAARLVLVEVDEVLRHPHHAGRVVHHDGAGGAEHGAGLGHAVEVHRDVDLVGGEDRRRGAAGDHRLAACGRPRMPPRVALAVDQLPQRDPPHRRLVAARARDVAADRVELGPAVLLGAVAREPLGARARGSSGTLHERLDVVDDGRAAVEAHHRREGRLDARLAALALERLDEGRLLAALVGARAAVDRGSRRRRRCRGCSCPRSPRRGPRRGPSRGCARPRGTRRGCRCRRSCERIAWQRDDDRLDQPVRVALDDDPVLVGAGLALVGVHAQVARLRVVLGQEAPLHPGREAGAAAAAQVRLLDLLDDRPRARILSHSPSFA